MKLFFSIQAISYLVFTLPSFSLLADGLSDLQSTLSKLKGTTELSATVESSYTEKRGKRKKQKTKTGLIQVRINDNHQGLKLIYSNETLEKLELESSKKEKDEDAETPTLNAIHGVGVAEMNTMLSAAPHLLRSLNKAKFINEEVVKHEDKNIRKLNFTLPLEAIIENKEVHEYVDDFNGEYQILIDDDGIPLESTTTFTGSGSAYIFFSMDITQTNQSTYKLIGDRLVNIKKTYQNKRSSTWGDTESNGYKILVPQQENPALVANY
ncbi:MAG: hypothetical protein KC484_06155 [Colwelliaceae bacterium]|nr:hypothetical protein [Colwelliaceae bacterium]